MIFQRTPLGLSNLHLFHDVDYIVFSEGGGQPEQNGKYRNLDIGYDCSFWSTVFAVFSNKRVRLLPKGSKSNLLENAEYIRENNIGNVLIALDRDFDDLNGNTLTDNFVIYTRGYSWETDVLSEQDISPFFYSVCPTCRASYNPIKDFQIWYQSIASNLRRFVYLDFLAVSNSRKIFDRSKPESVLTKNRNSVPDIDKAYLLKQFTDCKKQYGKPGTLIPYSVFDPYLHCHGKTFSSLIYRWLVFQANQVGAMTKISKNNFLGMAIAMLEPWMKSNPTSALHNYFQFNVARVIK